MARPLPVTEPGHCAFAVIGDVLMVADRLDTISEEKYYKQVLSYSVLVTLAGPLLGWAAIVVPGWI